MKGEQDVRGEPQQGGREAAPCDAGGPARRQAEEAEAEGFAEIAALTFLGWEWNDLTEARRKELADYFACVRIKNTREWKEEIVQIEGEDRRVAFVDRMLGEWRKDFARAFVQRVEYWLFGRSTSRSTSTMAIGCVRCFVNSRFRPCTSVVP